MEYFVRMYLFSFMIINKGGINMVVVQVIGVVQLFQDVWIIVGGG